MSEATSSFSPSPSPPDLNRNENSVSPRSPGPAVPTTGFAPAEEPVATTNKLERLAQVREAFQGLAAGDPVTALRAAKQLADPIERETALLTLVTEWTRGELGSPVRRARSIAAYGLEAGLGMELAQKPELAVRWANELTEGPARSALIRQVAIAVVGTDPTAAFTLREQLPPEERQEFSDAVFAGWAMNDTSAALEAVDQISDLSERDAALQAVRSVAPVGIGAALSLQDGYPVVNQLLPNTPAQLSGQIHPGDRILALSQPDGTLVDAHGLSLAQIVQMIRGAPGTVLQLQLLSADAPPNSPPRTVTITRDQIRYKR